MKQVCCPFIKIACLTEDSSQCTAMFLSSGLCILILSSFTFRGPAPNLSVFILIKDSMCRARAAGFSFEGEQLYRFESVTSYPNSFPLFKSYASFSELENIKCDHQAFIFLFK